jgi:hypothetical protein
MDPMTVIKKYSGCKLHVKHSGISGVSLESMYGFVTGEQQLDGAHEPAQERSSQPQSTPEGAVSH